jgi:hypothetical protein
MTEKEAAWQPFFPRITLAEKALLGFEGLGKYEFE